MNTECRVWKIAPGKEACHWAESCKRGYRAIGGLKKKSDMDFRDKLALRKEIKREWPEQKGEPTNDASSFWIGIH